MQDANEDSAVQDFLQILEEHRKNCEKQGKYVEAEIAKNRLEELKLHEENRRKDLCAQGRSPNVWVWRKHICSNFSSLTLFGIRR